MSVLISHASRDERGKYAGGKPGDQDEKEVCIRAWFNRPWNVVCRCKNPRMREKIAKAMTDAANNPCIGYSQSHRNSALTIARAVGYDPGKIKVNCDTDCSALVTLACIYAGIPENALYKGGNSSTTSNLKARLKATGAFEILTGKEYTQKPDKLLVGDVLISEGHHTAVVVKIETPREKSIHEIALEVKAGKWGDGEERRMRLAAAGLNPVLVQMEVNKLYGR